jgi:hypothetical protein
MRALLPSLALLAGCSPGFDPASYLTPSRLRVLGVVADPPEVAPGQPTTLTAIAPPLADGTPITFEWAICTQPPPPGTASVDSQCLTMDTASFLIPVDSTGPTAMVTMPASASPKTLGVPDTSGGFYVPVRVRAHAGTQRVDTIYGLRLALAVLPPNHNPVIATAAQVDAPLDASPSLLTELSTDENNPTQIPARSEPTLRLTLTPESYEQFPTLQGTPPNLKTVVVTEQPRFLWYADAGVLSQEITGQAQPDTLLKLDDKHAPAAGDVIHLWVVVHDDRGGTAYTKRFLVVR